jgi:antitoxin ParD1/3/4
MRNISVSLGKYFTNFVDAQVQTARYDSPSDVVRAGLRLLEDYNLKLQILQDALIEGEDSGLPAPFGSEAFLTRMQAKHGK